MLASEALWWLEYFEDARIAAEAAVEADPKSAQARWRLAVALYRRGRFSDSAKCLDDLLGLVNRFGPAWALRGQVKVWLDPDNREAGRSDFVAAANLDSDSGTWVVPYRIGRDDFEGKVEEELRIRSSEVLGSSDVGVFTDVEWLPEKSWIENGLDPDTRWHLPAIQTVCPPTLCFRWAESGLRGHPRSCRSVRHSFFISGTLRISAGTRRLSAKRYGKQWPSFSTGLAI